MNSPLLTVYLRNISVGTTSLSEQIVTSSDLSPPSPHQPFPCLPLTPQLFAGKEGKKLNSGEQFLAGFGAGVLEAIFAVTPIETVKTKAIQTNSPFLKGVKDILKAEGPKGLYQGVWATIAKQGSNQVGLG